MSPTTAAYGTWKSPLSVDAVTRSSLNLSSVSVEPATGAIYHIESRPSEGGRSVIVKRFLNAVEKEKDVFGATWNARSGAHEYGGGAMTAKAGIVWFSDYSSSRIYTVKEGKVEPFTPSNSAHRFADFRPHPTRPYLVSVLEDHTRPFPADVVTTLALLQAGKEPQVIASGADFYSSPRFSPDGKWLVWIQWMHPNMPWEGSELKLAEVHDDGDNLAFSQPKTIAGKEAEVSVSEPTWASSGLLLFQCDVSGFNNPWSYDVSTSVSAPLLPKPLTEECSAPAWEFGYSSLAVLSPTSFLMASTSQGIDRLYLLKISPAVSLTPISSPFVAISHLHEVTPTQVVFLGTTDRSPKSLVLLTLPDDITGSSKEPSFITIKASSPPDFPGELFSGAVPQTMRTKDGPVHVLYFPPNNPDFMAPEGDKPPAIISVHGGPTARADAGLHLTQQFFTTRGYAWVEVNYGGSTGYGKDYRNLLNGQWGVVDVRDTVASVEGLASLGLIDSTKVAIRGGSAGGFTVLAALSVAPDVFAAGTSLYGVSDLAKLAEDTHKFELRYMEKLVGGTPSEVPQLYRDRSPVNNAEHIKAPLLLLQGAVDAVVPPSQAELILEKIKKRGGKVEYVVFEGEGHGWRKAETMKVALEKELTWYESVFSGNDKV